MSENELIDAVQCFIDIVKSDTRIAVRSLPETDPNFDITAFWLQFRLESEKVARVATKMTLVYSMGPEVTPLLAELVAAYTSLLGLYLTLPRDRGAHLCKAVTANLVSIHRSLLAFLHLFISALKEPRGMKDLCCVGVLLEECKQVSSLPRDNTQAVIQVIKSDHDFMIDTVDEITREMKNQINLRRSGKQGVVLDEESEMWSETELSIVSDTLRLAKLGRTSTDTALKVLQEREQTAIPSLLDQLASHSAQLSPQLDDLFAFIYPPIDDEALPSLVDKFVGSLNSMLDSLSSLPDVSEQHKELSLKIKIALSETGHKLKSLLVSNEILAIQDLSLHQ